MGLFSKIKLSKKNQSSKEIGMKKDIGTKNNEDAEPQQIERTLSKKEKKQEKKEKKLEKKLEKKQEKLEKKQEKLEKKQREEDNLNENDKVKRSSLSIKRRSQSLFLMRKTNGSSRMSILPSFDEGDDSETTTKGIKSATSNHNSINEEKAESVVDDDSESDYEYDSDCYMEVRPF